MFKIIKYVFAALACLVIINEISDILYASEKSKPVYQIVQTEVKNPQKWISIDRPVVVSCGLKFITPDNKEHIVLVGTGTLEANQIGIWVNGEILRD